MSNFENLTGGAIKAAMREAGASSSDLWMVPLDGIKVLDGFNVRTHNAEYEAHIESLTESILQNGFHKDKPLAGFVAKEDGKDVIYVTDGHSRFKAVQRAIAKGAEITALPVVTKPSGTSLEDLTIGLVVSNSGKPLTPLELAAVCKRLIGYNMDEAVIATRLGYTKQYIQSLLTLVAAPVVIRKMVESGKVSAANAITAIAKHGDKAVDTLKAAQDKAEAQGKAKVTQKQLNADKPPKVDRMGDAMLYIKERPECERENLLTVAAILSGKPLVELQALVA